MKQSIVESNRFCRTSLRILPFLSIAWCASASENMSGYTRAPRCSSGTRNDQRPRLPPLIDGDADISRHCLPLNGCGRIRDVQSITFLRIPGMELLYSGDAMMKASVFISLSRRRCAPEGTPAPCSTSPSSSYDGHSKSESVARSAIHPFSSIVVAASDASRSLKEFLRSDAPKTSAVAEQRTVVSISAPPISRSSPYQPPSQHNGSGLPSATDSGARPHCSGCPPDGRSRNTTLNFPLAHSVGC